MILANELKTELRGYTPKIAELREVLGIDAAVKEKEELAKKTVEADFWNDSAGSKKVLKQISTLESKIKKFSGLSELYDDAETLIELAEESDDEDTAKEARDSLKRLESLVDEVTLDTLLTGEYDSSNAIVSFHAGAGGTEAQDWTEMLMRMYEHWADSHGCKVTVLDVLDGNDAGIKSATMMIEGENCYGYLKSEAGIHRLVRISPFDSSGSRHTSFAAVDVMPEIDDTIEVNIRPEDIEVATYRASGAGGQHINKTDSAVRITHIPTGIVCACQTQRSQLQNKDYAMKMLKAKLIEIKEREHLEKIEDIKGVQKEIAWGSQIRSYVFMPYTLVKDHRTGYEQGNVSAVMDGDIDGFINAYLKALSKGEIEK